MTAAPSNALIQITDVRLSLARRLVLNLDHLEIKRGEIVLLAGANGAGKTTLLKLLAGLLSAQSGQFMCLGIAMPPRRAAKFCLGRHIYLHQTPYLFDGTVAENVAYGLKQRGRDAQQREIEIRDALAWAQLEHLTHRHASELSTGERQRVALTRARILTPALLLLDEITANMDQDSRQRSLSLVEDLKRSGSSIVFATHATSEIAEIADRVVQLDGGCLSPAGATTAAVIPLRRERGAEEPNR